MVAGIHRQDEGLASFSFSSFFFPRHLFIVFVVRMQCISVDFTSCGLLPYKIRVPDSLCSPLIRCRMQGKRTDYCKVRIEVLNLFPGENSGQNS